MDEEGGIGQMRGRREERGNPKGPEGREGGRAPAGNRDYLQRRPRFAVRLGWKARRPGSQPRPVSSATRVRPWPMSLLRCNVEVREVAGLGRRSQEQNKATGGETHAGTVGFETGENSVWAGPRPVGVGGAPAGWDSLPPTEVRTLGRAAPSTGRTRQRPGPGELASAPYRVRPAAAFTDRCG